MSFYYCATGRFKIAISEWDSYLVLVESECKKGNKEILNLTLELSKKFQ